MKRILLTSTALVMVAGIAAADGHASVSWSGTATAGVARNGGAEAAAAVAATARSSAAHISLRNAADGYGFTVLVRGATTNVADTAVYSNQLLKQQMRKRLLTTCVGSCNCSRYDTAALAAASSCYQRSRR